MLLIGHPVEFKWYEYHFWTGKHFCDLGQQADLFTNSILVTRRCWKLKTKKNYHGFERNPFLTDSCDIYIYIIIYIIRKKLEIKEEGIIVGLLWSKTNIWLVYFKSFSTYRLPPPAVQTEPDSCWLHPASRSGWVDRGSGNTRAWKCCFGLEALAMWSGGEGDTGFFCVALALALAWNDRQN